MKRFSTAILILLQVLTISVFAGDVPEGMLHDYEAQVFFARLEDYLPDSNGEAKAKLVPTKLVKGEVQLGGEGIWYADALPCGDFTVTIGDEYLFLYNDEYNPTYFFKTTTTDTKTLKFEGEVGDMWDRLEDYLNDGEFEKAEKQRIEDAKARTLSQLLDSDAPFTDEVQVIYRKGSDGGKIKVDKNNFFELLDEISCTRITPALNSETDGFFIKTISDTGREREIFISAGGLVSKNNPASSMADAAEYKINRDDLRRIYEYLNIKMPGSNKTVIYISAAFLLVLICGFVLLKNRFKK